MSSSRLPEFVARLLRRRGSRSDPDLRRCPDLADEREFLSAWKRCRPYTMTSLERMYSLWQAARHVAAAPVEGDLVECGVWKGGSAMLAALALLSAGESRRVLWLYDTFTGMSAPTERDVDLAGRDAGAQWRTAANRGGWCSASLEEVRAAMLSTGYPVDRLRLVAGNVEQTLPAQAPERIALLRLDTDWYESTRHELVHLWPRLAPGGVLIVDDYGHWRGARRAVDEYFARQPVLLNRVDYTARLAVKGG